MLDLPPVCTGNLTSISPLEQHSFGLPNVPFHSLKNTISMYAWLPAFSLESRAPEV